MKNKKILVAVMVVITATGFVLADYFALFGSSERTEFILQEIRFRPVNEGSNSPIIGARIRCFQAGRKKDVCFQKNSGKLGLVSIMVPRSRISSNSLLFEQSYHFSSHGSTDINIMLMHLDYVNHVNNYDANDLFENLEKIHQIKMQPNEYDEPDD